MASDTTTTLAALLKPFYGTDKAIKAIGSRAKFWGAINNAQVKKVEKVRGKNLQMRVPVITQASGGFGIVPENGTLPAAMPTGSTELVWPTYKWVGSVSVTVEADIASQDSEYAFAQAMNLQFKLMEDNMVERVNNMMMVDGTGYLGSNTIAMTADLSTIMDNGLDARLFRAGLKVDSYTAKTGGVLQVDGAEIDYVDYTTGEVFFTAVQTCDALSFWFIHDSPREEVMGIQGIADDGTVVPTIAGITRSGNPWANGRVFDATGEPLSELLIQETLDLQDLGEYGDGDMSDDNATVLLLCDLTTRRYLAQLLLPYVRNNTPGDLKGGVKKFTYDFFGKTIQLVADKHVLPGTIYFLNPKGLLWGWAKKPGWWDAGGSVISKDFVGATMAEVAWFYYIGNFCATHFPTQCVLENFDPPA